MKIQQPQISTRRKKKYHRHTVTSACLRHTRMPTRSNPAVVTGFCSSLPLAEFPLLCVYCNYGLFLLYLFLVSFHCTRLYSIRYTPLERMTLFDLGEYKKMILAHSRHTRHSKAQKDVRYGSLSLFTSCEREQLRNAGIDAQSVGVDLFSPLVDLLGLNKKSFKNAAKHNSILRCRWSRKFFCFHKLLPSGLDETKSITYYVLLMRRKTSHRRVSFFFFFFFFFSVNARLQHRWLLPILTHRRRCSLFGSSPRVPVLEPVVFSCRFFPVLLFFGFLTSTEVCGGRQAIEACSKWAFCSWIIRYGARIKAKGTATVFDVCGGFEKSQWRVQSSSRIRKECDLVSWERRRRPWRWLSCAWRACSV